jgi:hypothetical protein
MATITRLEFELAPGNTVDTLLVRVTTTFGLTDFDVATGLKYTLIHRLFAVGAERRRPGRPTTGPGGIDLDLDLDIEVEELQRFPSIFLRSAGSPNPIDETDVFGDLSDLLVHEMEDGEARVDEYEITRTTADEDPDEDNPDELQIRTDFVPHLPTAATVLSNMVRVDL